MRVAAVINAIKMPAYISRLEFETCITMSQRCADTPTISLTKIVVVKSTSIITQLIIRAGFIHPIFWNILFRYN